jgi:hypothetical protein
MKQVVFALIAICALAAGCSHEPEGPVDIVGTSGKYTVEGKYAPIVIDRVDALSIDGGKLAVHGSSTTQTEDLPAGAEASKPEPHWSLTTETDSGNKRMLTFTHNESMAEFTIPIPKGTADVHYGTLQNSQGNDVMLLAWGELAHCYWGYVTITPKPGAN